MQNKRQQKQIFLASEADAWFERNRAALASIDYSKDLVNQEILEIAQFISSDTARLSILEVGCGEGRRLGWLSTNLSAQVAGIEPSSMAVAAARRLGIDARQGTAESLPWEDGCVDVLIFGFCLYLCDPEDLFRIAFEADRVLKSNSWIVIQDFYAKEHVRRPYHHAEGVMSNKMDFRKLFDWHPAYTCYSFKLNSHSSANYDDHPQEWVATTVLRKKEIA